MSKWSNELIQMTLSGTYSLAVVKNEDHDYGIVMTTEPKVTINSIQVGAFMPVYMSSIIASMPFVLLQIWQDAVPSSSSSTRRPSSSPMPACSTRSSLRLSILCLSA